MISPQAEKRLHSLQLWQDGRRELVPYADREEQKNRSDRQIDLSVALLTLPKVAGEKL